MTLQIWNSLRSQTLDMRTTLTVVTPEGDSANPIPWPKHEEPGLLILLHGLTGNNMIWPMRTDLSALANRHNLVIAMPDGDRSFWLNQEFGLDFGKWVGEELPQILKSTLRISNSRDKTFIGGLSMGGYGAIHAAFDYPQTFGGAFALSGTLNVAETAFRGRHGDLYKIGFGNLEKPRPQDDLIYRLEHTDISGLKDMKLFACCGHSDRLYEQNLQFIETSEKVGLDVKWDHGPGDHDFTFWNKWLPIALEAVTNSGS